MIKRGMRGPTCIAPSACNGVCHADDGGRKHDGGPELAHDKGRQGAADDEALEDIANRVGHHGHAEHWHGRGCEQESVRCSTTGENESGAALGERIMRRGQIGRCPCMNIQQDQRRRGE